MNSKIRLAALSVLAASTSLLPAEVRAQSPVNLVAQPGVAHKYKGTSSAIGALSIDGNINTAQSALSTAIRPPTRAEIRSEHKFPTPQSITSIYIKATADAEAPNLRTTGSHANRPIFLMTRIAVEYTKDGKTWYEVDGASLKERARYKDNKNHDEPGDHCSPHHGVRDDGTEPRSNGNGNGNGHDDDDDDHDDDDDDDDNEAFRNLNSVLDSTFTVNLTGVRGVRAVAKSRTVGSNPASPISKAHIYELQCFNGGTVVTPPTVATLDASNVTTTGATLNGTVNPNGSPATAQFNFGTTNAVTGSTPAVNVGGGTSIVAANSILTGLQPHTQYFFRASGTNAGGTTNGSVLSFTTGNSTPTAANGAANVAANGQAPATLGGADADGDALTYTIVNATGGSATVSGGSATFVPDGTWTGSGSFVYSVADGFGGTAQGTVSVGDLIAPTVTQTAPAAGIPVGPGGTAPLPNVLGLFNATDNVAVTSFAQSPAPGTPAPSGPSTITVTALDAAGNVTSQNVVVTVAANTAPTASNGSANVGAAGTASLDLAPLAADVDGNALNFSVGAASGGTASLAGSVVTFTPNGTWTGSGTVAFTVNDGMGGTATANIAIGDLIAPTVAQTGAPASPTAPTGGTAALPDVLGAIAASDNIAVTSITQSPAAGTALGAGSHNVVVTARDAAGNEGTTTVAVTIAANTLPTATNGTADVAANGVASLDLATLAADVDGNALNFSVGAASGGTASLAGSVVTFTPNGTWTGSGTVAFTVNDGMGGTATANVAIRDLIAPAVAQTGAPLSPIVNVGGTVPLPDVLGVVAATDNVAVTSVSQSPAAGTATGPGTHNVTVTARDAAGNEGTRVVVVSIGENMPPNAGNGTAFVGTAGTASFDLTTVATDPNGQPLTFSVTSSAGGSANLAGSIVTFTPGAWTGSGSFTYSANDGFGGTSSGVVTVSDAIAPTLVLATAPASPLTGPTGTAALPDVTGNVTSTDNIAVTGESQVAPAGTLATPGTVNILVTATDAAGNEGTLSVPVIVRDGTNPVITSSPATLELETPSGTQTIALPDWTNGITATDNSGTVTITQSPAAGTVLGVGTSAVVFTATDPSGNNVSVSIPLTITLGNQTPEATHDYAFSKAEGVLIDVLENDFDLEAAPLTLVGISEASNGTAVVEAGKVRFIPSGSLNGNPGSLTYIVTDGELTAEGTVTVYDPPDVSTRYAGLLYPHGDNQGASGICSFNFGSEGTPTGSITRERTKYAFVGSIGATSPAFFTATVGTQSIVLRVSAGPLDAYGNPSVGFSVDSPYVGDRRWTGAAEQSPYNLDNPLPLSGRFTAVANNPVGANAPEVGAMPILNITNLGSVSLTGKSGNNKTLACNSMVLQGGRIPFYDVTNTSGTVASVSGFFTLDLAGPQHLSGSLRWIQPVGTEARLPLGLDATYGIVGAQYNESTGTSGGMLALNGLGTVDIHFYPYNPLNPTVSVVRNLGALNVIPGDEPLLEITFYPGLGTFNGNVGMVFGQPKRNFQGIVVQGAGLNFGQGIILDNGSIGHLDLLPQP